MTTLAKPLLSPLAASPKHDGEKLLLTFLCSLSYKALRGWGEEAPPQKTICFILTLFFFNLSEKASDLTASSKKLFQPVFLLQLII